MDLYIYYKVGDADAAALLRAVAAMQAQLALRFGVTGQLKRRPGAPDGLQTWMEVYPAAGERFATALDEAVLLAGLPALIAGPRHTEMFMDLAPCV